MEERLQKIIAHAGIASRRTAERMISEGRVSVNGDVVISLGAKADAEKDEIKVDGNLISCNVPKIYLMLNKPKGYVTTLHDPQNRPIVTDLLSGISDRVFPVGRLDYDSEGLLLLTNDGYFAQRFQHPRFQIPKTYRIKIRGNLSKEEFRCLEKGVELSDGKFKPTHIHIEKINKKSCWLILIITEGRNRIIRRCLESIGHSVVRLIRTAIADIHLDDLDTGSYRLLTKSEREKLLFLNRSPTSYKKLS